MVPTRRGTTTETAGGGPATIPGGPGSALRALLLPVALALPAGGCSGEIHLLEQWLAGSRTALVHGSPWTWLVLPLLGLVTVETLALLLERRRPDPPAPGVAGGGPPGRQALLPWGLLAAAAVALAFAALNVVVPIEPADKLRNVGLWFLGTLAGAAAALVLAWRFHGERRPDPTFPSRAGSASSEPD